MHSDEFKLIGKFEFKEPIAGKDIKSAELKYRTFYHRGDDPFYQYVLCSEGLIIFDIHLRVYLSVAVALDAITANLQHWPEFKRFNDNAYRMEGHTFWTKII